MHDRSPKSPTHHLHLFQFPNKWAKPNKKNATLNMAARLGLSTATVFSLGPRKALPLPLPCLLPAPHRHFFTSRYSPISPLLLQLQLVTVRNLSLSQLTMSASLYNPSPISSYDKDLAAAKKAASLAARLCQVLSNSTLIAFNSKN